MELSKRSEQNLLKVHPDLVRVVRRAAKIINDPTLGFVVTCGIRTLAQQKELLRIGATTTLNSRHLPGKSNKLSHAVDIAVTYKGKVKWDWPLYVNMAVLMKQAAADVGVPLEWGGDWKSFKDGPHYQLPVRMYPG